MPLMISFGQVSIDLLEISVENYRQLDTQPKIAREQAVKFMLDTFSNTSMLQAIEHLSQVCFDVHHALFIRRGPSSFLADILKAHIDKHDGDRFVRTYHEEGKDGLRHFKFSQQPTAVFYLLWHEASTRAYADAQYVEYLPINISNKIWQAMILERAVMSGASPSSLALISKKMQELAQDSGLLKAILMSNLDIESSYDKTPVVQQQEALLGDGSRSHSLLVADRDRFFADLTLRNVQPLGSVVVREQVEGDGLLQPSRH